MFLPRRWRSSPRHRRRLRFPLLPGGRGGGSSAEGESASPKQPADRSGIVVNPHQRLRLVPGHAALEERPPERPDAALAVRLVSEEPPTEAGGQDREGFQEDHWQPVPAIRHQSSPCRLFPTAFAIIPPMLSEDMYCSVSRKACSSVMPLSFRVL